MMYVSMATYAKLLEIGHILPNGELTEDGKKAIMDASIAALNAADEAAEEEDE